MGALSLLCSVARALNGGFERKILLCWGADAFVVALGAPIGALVLTPAAASTLRRLFYVMAVRAAGDRAHRAHAIAHG